LRKRRIKKLLCWVKICLRDGIRKNEMGRAFFNFQFKNDESTYEDSRFLPKGSKKPSDAVSTRKSRSRSRRSLRDTATDAKTTPPIIRVPSHIVITDAPSDFSSVDSWRLSSTLAPPATQAYKMDLTTLLEPAGYKSSVPTGPVTLPVDRIKRDSPDWIPASKAKLRFLGKDSPTQRPSLLPRKQWVRDTHQ
jgi:hypothetical protein